MNWRLFKVILFSSFLGLMACSDGGGGDDDNNDDGQQDGNQNSTGSAEVSFNLSGAVSVVANEDAVEDTSSGSALNNLFSRLGGEQTATFSYRIVDGVSATNGEGGASNLLAIDASGNASLAIDTNFPIKVMYSVASPDGTKLYLALDPGWWSQSSDGLDYSQIISEMNCALLEVTIADNSFSCVAEGLFVQNMNEQYYQRVSGNQKPLQFDRDGNLYFSATEFTVECDQQDENGDCLEDSFKWLNINTWQPRIYSRLLDGTLNAISQDNEYVEFFLALKTGEVAYQSWRDDGSASLKIINLSGQVVPLSNDNWVNFFTTDSENAVVWGEYDWSNGENGLKMARPNPNGAGFELASLDTSLFGSNNNGSWASPTPHRIIMADDGRVYGVFEGGSGQYDENNIWTWLTYLKVYQILPYDGVPKVELILDNNDWWHWMQDTPFQISRGYLYYTEEVDIPFLGTSDVIRMVNLTTRDSNTLLDSQGTRYQMYNWRLSGNTLFFSALDLDSNTVVTGKVDTLGVRNGESESEYLEIQETASASSAASKVQDIEVIAPTAPEVEAGNLVVQEVHVDPVNVYSMSVDFNKYMDPTTIEGNVTITSSDTGEGDNGDIPTFKLWLYKTLHLIPDLQVSSAPLGLPETEPLSFDTTYTLAFNASSIRDLSGFELDPSTPDTVLNTRPSEGWFSSSLVSSVDTSIASGSILNYATDITTYDKKTWELYQNTPDNFMVEFSAKNFAWDGVDIMLLDTTQGADDWANLFLNYRLGGWSNLEWATNDNTTSYGHNWQDKDTNQILFNGVWKRYRIKVYGSNIELWYSSETDGTSFTKIDDLSKTDLVARRGATNYRLLLRAANPVALDNVEISSLDGSGSVTGSLAGPFDGSSVPTGLQGVVTDSWDPNNIW